MAVRLRGSGFQVDLTLPGWKRLRPQFDTKEAAEAWELQAKANHKLGLAPPDVAVGSATQGGRVSTLNDLIDLCEKRKWRKPTDHNAEQIRKARNFAKWAGPNRPVRDVLNEDKMAEWIEYHEDVLGNSGSTINRHSVVYRTLVNEAARLKLIEGAFKVPYHPEGQCRLRVFSEQEEATILRVLRQWGYDKEADYLVFLADTGVRPAEARRLVWSDFVGRKIILEHDITKNSTQRVLAATPRVQEALARCDRTQPGPFSWAVHGSMRHLWQRLRGHLDWMDETTVIYTYRHTCASRLVQRGVDLYRVQIWMGHKSIAMTQRYAKFAPKHLEELADVLARPLIAAE